MQFFAQPGNHDTSMKTINIGCDLSYSVNAAASFLFQIAVPQNSHQNVSNEVLQSTPYYQLSACQSGLHANRLHRVLVQPGEFRLQYSAVVELSQSVAHENDLEEIPHSLLPVDVLPFLTPSRYCESDKLTNFAWNTFGQIPAGHRRVQAVADWVHAHMSYIPGTTNSMTTACDVLVQCTGVCRDYAHLSIAICRALGIPARYVSGYAVNLQPPDFHGFHEVYMSNAWHLFDATKLAPVTGFVRIGAGLDAADVSFATIIGWVGTIAQSAWAIEQIQAAPDPNGNGTSQNAISSV